MKSILRLLILLVLVSIAGLAYWRHGERWLAEAPKPAAQRLEEGQRRCFYTHVYDDGNTATQHRWIAHAVLNLSEAKKQSICRIFADKTALAAPSEEGTMALRSVEWTEALEDYWPLWGDKVNRARGEIEADRVLKERTADYVKEPCLQYVTRYVRPKKFGTIQNEQKFRQEMELLFDEGTARFYGPRGTKC